MCNKKSELSKLADLELGVSLLVQENLRTGFIIRALRVPCGIIYISGYWPRLQGQTGTSCSQTLVTLPEAYWQDGKDK